MIKSLLILLLAAALAGAAFLTRPTATGFDAYLRGRQKQRTFLETVGDVLHPKHYVVKDRYLWVDVERDGNVAYRGAFGHFFERGDESSKK